MNHIDSEVIQLEDFQPDNQLKLTTNPNTNERDIIGIINIWTEDGTVLDPSISTGEWVAMYYAFDPSLTPEETLELQDRSMNEAEFTNNGITYTVYNMGKLKSVKAIYDGFEIEDGKIVR